jgi:hypothetical protein
MPRLFFSPEAGGGYETPAPSRRNNNNDLPFGEASYSNDVRRAPASSSSSSSSSVRLSCMSPDGKSIHSLMIDSSGSSFIETHTLPLVGTVENDNNVDAYKSKAAIIRTKLSEFIAAALRRYPTIELLCVDVDSPPPSSSKHDSPFQSPAVGARKGSSLVRLPLLCLYTKKDVFLLELGYEPNGTPEVDGQILSSIEPYGDYLLENTTVNIVCIQQAPQQSKGHATISPRGAMAMLTESPMNAYDLVLYSGGSPRDVKTHSFTQEDLIDPNERIVDFCFCRSRSLSLLSSLTVAFLKASGMVMAATPILFQGTIVTKNHVSQTIDFLESALNDVEPYTAKWRQLRVAKQYIVDAFPDSGASNFVGMAADSSTQAGRHFTTGAFSWKVGLSPLLTGIEPTEEIYDGSQPMATCIIPFADSGDLVGIAIGFTTETIDISIASPSVLIPTFDEGTEDDFDRDAEPMGATINRIDVSSDESTVKDIRLIPDPIMDSVVHVVTPEQIISVSTNAARVASNKAREGAPKTGHIGGSTIFSPPSKRGDLKPRTTAWSCLDVSYFQEGRQNPIVGASVSGDVTFGHVLVARLLNGKVVALNLTEARHLHEMDSETEASSGGFLAITDGRCTHKPPTSEAEQRAMRALQETEPLSESVQPLIQQVYAGLSKMAMIGGTSTESKDITLDIMAGAVAIQERCQKDVFLPIVQMNEHVVARRTELQNLCQKQAAALKALGVLIGKLREKQSAIQEKTEVVKINAKSLADRTSSLLQSSTDLLPTITQSEYDYFQEISRIDSKTREWGNQAKVQQTKVQTIQDSIENGTIPGPLNASDKSIDTARTLVKASAFFVAKSSTKLQSLEEKLDQLAAVAGFLVDPDKPLPINQ